jgi:hypothetical protein
MRFLRGQPQKEGGSLALGKKIEVDVGQPQKFIGHPRTLSDESINRDSGS